MMVIWMKTLDVGLGVGNREGAIKYGWNKKKLKKGYKMEIKKRLWRLQ